MAVVSNLDGIVQVDIVSRETGGSGREEFHNVACYRHSNGVGVLTTDYKALADALSGKIINFLTPDMTLDRIVIATAAPDSDSGNPSVWAYPYGQIGVNSLAGPEGTSTMPLNVVAKLKFGVDGGRSGGMNLRGVLRTTDVVFSRGAISLQNNQRDRFNNLAQDLVSAATWVRCTVRKIPAGFAVADCLTGAFGGVGFRQLDRNTRAKISTRESSLRKRAEREVRERLYLAASYNVLATLGELDNAAADAAIINAPLPELTGAGPAIPAG